MLQAATKHFKRFRHSKSGISTVIVVMLSLALLVTVVGNMVLWSYQMNELDMQRIQENVNLKNVTQTKEGTSFELKNSSPTGVRIVAIWVDDATTHKRYTANLFLNPGETESYTIKDIFLPKDYNIVKVVTERGNIAVYSPT
jgi:hypothetical protein